MGHAELPFQHLFDLSNDHGAAHGESCHVYPGPQAPKWAALASAFAIESVLEIGCGRGYQAVYIADAAAGCRVETIENDSEHADLAAAHFSSLGFADGIKILEGDAESILPGPGGPFDMVIQDAGVDYSRWLPELTRLTRPGGLLITRNLSDHIPDWESQLPTHAITIVRSRPIN